MSALLLPSHLIIKVNYHIKSIQRTDQNQVAISSLGGILSFMTYSKHFPQYKVHIQ